MPVTRPLLLAALLGALLLAACHAAPTDAPPDLSGYPWLYLRDGEPVAAAEAPAEVVVVGDVMLGRGVAEESAPLAAVAPWLRDADLAVGNLEASIAGGGAPPRVPEGEPQPILLRAPLSAMDTLRDAGFDLLGLANNHALDGGPAGLAESVERLAEAGMATVGAGGTVEEAYRPTFTEIKGVRIAWLAVNLVPIPHASGEGWQPAMWDEARATEAIRAARAEADVLVVLAHWGYEYERRVDPSQRRAAEAMWAAGADVVVGAHPHVAQETAAREGHFAAFSLGNFVFDQSSAVTREGLALRLFVDGEGLRAVQALPLVAGPRPRLMSPDEGRALLDRVAPPPPRLGFECDAARCWEFETAQEVARGRFTSGRIDLTGDGAAEEVRLTEGEIVVSDGGRALWRGLPEWTVSDLALGDPNDDGRGEALLALWKADEGGTARSHPFIVGWRGGAWRVLWGGSAVAEPIHEVELGDVDGDGREELVVIEEAEGGGRRVALWAWHGWGYSLRWRSAVAHYEDLVVRAGSDGRARFSVAVRPPFLLAESGVPPSAAAEQE